jgi:enoyl-CoA hydratase
MNVVDYSHYQHLKIEKIDGLAIVTLNRPPHNLINMAMHHEVTQIPRDLRRDDEVRAIVLASSGKNFCAGGDRDLYDFYKDDPQGQMVHFEQCRDLINNMIDLEKPIVAAVHGLVAGLLSQVVLLCDIIIAADDDKTRFLDGHMNIAVAPGDGGALVWPARIGLARAKRYLLTGDPVPAREAERIGMVTELAPPDELLERAVAWGRRFVDGPALATRWTKASLNQWLRRDAADILNYSWALMVAGRGLPENQEAFEASRDKRPPKYR